MAVRLNDAIRDQLVDALGTIITGTNAAYLYVYTGSQPASANSAPSGTLLVTFDLTTNDFSAASSGSSELNTLPVAATAVASGTAGWARLTNGVARLDGSVGTGGTDFILSDVAMSSGLVYNLTGCSLAIPAS